MDLTNVKDLKKKMRICNRIHSIGLIACVVAYAIGAVLINTYKVTGIVLLAASVLVALISGSAQVMESLLYAEDLYRITGRRPQKKRTGRL